MGWHSGRQSFSNINSAKGKLYNGYQTDCFDESDSRQVDSKYRDGESKTKSHFDTQHNDTEHYTIQHKGLFVTFSITTLRINGLFVTLSINDTQNKRHSANMLIVIMLSLGLYKHYATCHYARCHYVECRFA
jgi:hypothetical protein